MPQDRVYYYKMPVHARDWYQRNCCPACGRVNGTGRLCRRTVACLCCQEVVCVNTSGVCPLCSGVLDGYLGSEKRYEAWKRRQKRLKRKEEA
jgi:hypothetical protein